MPRSIGGLFPGRGSAPPAVGRPPPLPGRRPGREADPEQVRLRAEALAARLPALLAEADRVAATVAQGVHGRRRAGSGDSFWQYRPLAPGEPAGRVDWRQSARSSRAFVRETEWEAAQTVCLWCDSSGSMDWRSDERLPFKRARAELLVVALAILLLRAGEHLRLLDAGGAARYGGRQAAERLARHLLADPAPRPGPAPSWPDLPRHARLVLVGDFLAPPAELQAALAGYAALPVAPQLVQVLDPAELALPYAGRIRFEGTEGEPAQLVPRAQEVRAGYQAVLSEHQERLAALCGSAGCRLLTHRTDQRPETALLALHAALGRHGRAA